MIMGMFAARLSTIILTYLRAIDTTWTRRSNLEASKCFVCACARCSDPGEAGAESSSLLCAGLLDPGCGGVLRPADTLNMQTQVASNLLLLTHLAILITTIVCRAELM